MGAVARYAQEAITDVDRFRKQRAALPTRDSIVEDINERIDERCRQIATRILEKGLFKTCRGWGRGRRPQGTRAEV